MSDQEQSELEGMPATSPKVYVSGTPTAPEDSIFGRISKEELGSKVTMRIVARVSKEGIQAQREGTRPFVNVSVTEILSAVFND